MDVNCTVPDNPNSLRFCDDGANGIPFKKNFKMSGSLPILWGITVSGVFQSNESPSGTTVATSRNMTFTRGTTRYPASCPAPCPGRADHRAGGGDGSDHAGDSARAVQLVVR